MPLITSRSCDHWLARACRTPVSRTSSRIACASVSNCVSGMSSSSRSLPPWAFCSRASNTDCVSAWTGLATWCSLKFIPTRLLDRADAQRRKLADEQPHDEARSIGEERARSGARRLHPEQDSRSRPADSRYAWFANSPIAQDADDASAAVHRHRADSVVELQPLEQRARRPPPRRRRACRSCEARVASTTSAQAVMATSPPSMPLRIRSTLASPRVGPRDQQRARARRCSPRAACSRRSARCVPRAAPSRR